MPTPPLAGLVVGWGVTHLLGRHAVRRFAELTVEGEPLAPQLRAVGLFARLVDVAEVNVLSLGLLSAGGAGSSSSR